MDAQLLMLLQRVARLEAILASARVPVPHGVEYRDNASFAAIPVDAGDVEWQGDWEVTYTQTSESGGFYLLKSPGFLMTGAHLNDATVNVNLPGFTLGGDGVDDLVSEDYNGTVQRYSSAITIIEGHDGEVYQRHTLMLYLFNNAGQWFTSVTFPADYDAEDPDSNGVHRVTYVHPFTFRVESIGEAKSFIRPTRVVSSVESLSSPSATAITTLNPQAPFSGTVVLTTEAPNAGVFTLSGQQVASGSSLVSGLVGFAPVTTLQAATGVAPQSRLQAAGFPGVLG
jgi:hypothetical protein